MNNWRILMAVMLMTTSLAGYSQHIEGVNDIKTFLTNYLDHTTENKSQIVDFQNADQTSAEDCDTLRYVQVNLLIWDLLSNNPIRHDSDLKEIAIVGFRKLSNPIHVGVLMKYHNFFEVLSMTDENTGDHREYSAVLDDLQHYFSKYQDIDRRLLPLYNKVVLDTYISNTQADELGPWFEWYEAEQYKYVNTKR